MADVFVVCEIVFVHYLLLIGCTLPMATPVDLLRVRNPRWQV